MATEEREQYFAEIAKNVDAARDLRRFATPLPIPCRLHQIFWLSILACAARKCNLILMAAKC